MIISASLVIAFIIIITARPASAHQFTDHVKLDISNTMKYGANWNFSLPVRDAISQHPREFIVKNNIKSISSFCYTDSGDSFKRSYEEYDDAGNMTRSFEFDPDGSVVKTTIINYNSDSKIAELVEYTPAGNIDVRQTFKYDGAGEISEFECFDRGDKPSYKIEYERDERVTRETRRSAEDGSVSETVYKYSNGRLIEKNYDWDRGVRVTEFYNYDDHNRLLNIITVNSENSEVSRWDYKFNESGLPVEIIFCNASAGFTIKKFLLYDKAGELISLASDTSGPKMNMSLLYRFERDQAGNWTFKYFSDGADHPNEVFSYDRNGGLVEFASYSEDGEVEHVFKYTYSGAYTETPPADPATFAIAANIKKECIRNMKMLEGVLELYELENAGELPANLENLAGREYIKEVPRCPGNGKYSFEKIDISEGAGTPCLRIKVECSVHGGLY